MSDRYYRPGMRERDAGNGDAHVAYITAAAAICRAQGEPFAQPFGLVN
jgi:hypothetical protein